MIFSELLRERREERGESLAELANFLGVSESAIRSWESGECVPRGVSLLRILSRYNMDESCLQESFVEATP